MTEHRYLSLGFALRSDAPSPPAIPTLQREPFMTIPKDGANVTLLRLTSHTGTHLDVPRHVFDDGLTVTDLAPADFIFDRPVVLDLPLGDCAVVMPDDLAPLSAQAHDADFLLFRFGYGGVRRADPPDARIRLATILLADPDEYVRRAAAGSLSLLGLVAARAAEAEAARGAEPRKLLLTLAITLVVSTLLSSS